KIRCCSGSKTSSRLMLLRRIAAEAADPAERASRTAKRRMNRGSLPAHLPHVEIVVDIEDRICPCCGKPLHRIGEDTSERLDIVPAQFRVLMVRRPKYADHLPLYRQAQIYARQGVDLDRSTLADWVGRAAFLLRPIHERLLLALKGSAKLFADETTAPVLDPAAGAPSSASYGPMHGMIGHGAVPTRQASPMCMRPIARPSGQLPI